MKSRETTLRVVLLEPYYGGSHRAFLKGLQRCLSFDFTLISLPARKWKMRMQLAAPWMAEQVLAHIRSGRSLDVVLCSTFLDVALLRSILFKEGVHYPVAVYYHENQFAYPGQVADPSRYQFSALNFTTALAADRIAFNSGYNYDTFMDGVLNYLNKATDMEVVHLLDELQRKSVILYPGMDFTDIDGVHGSQKHDIPVLLWNHRWEHDKDPDTFFRVLTELSEEGVDFRLIVLGQSFERCPDVFVRVRERLGPHILHFGYAEDEQAYARFLGQGDIVVSTAKHEFFGMAVLEAVRAGCRPVVPDRLAYRELFPDVYRYPEGRLKSVLRSLMIDPHPLTPEESERLTERFSWSSLREEYRQWLTFP